LILNLLQIPQDAAPAFGNAGHTLVNVGPPAVAFPNPVGTLKPITNEEMNLPFRFQEMSVFKMGGRHVIISMFAEPRPISLIQYYDHFVASIGVYQARFD
jgi:hypothetical protein